MSESVVYPGFRIESSSAVLGQGKIVPLIASPAVARSKAMIYWVRSKWKDNRKEYTREVNLWLIDRIHYWVDSNIISTLIFYWRLSLFILKVSYSFEVIVCNCNAFTVCYSALVHPCDTPDTQSIEIRSHLSIQVVSRTPLLWNNWVLHKKVPKTWYEVYFKIRTLFLHIDTTAT